MSWVQKTIELKARPRGMHLITAEVAGRLPELSGVRCGLLHLFLQHTSAALTVNENADPDVRADLEEHLSLLMPDAAPHYRHRLEGGDDMAAHLKSSVLGCSLTLPVSGGRLALGTWQGIYLCELRGLRQPRTLVATLWGEP